MNKIEGSLCLLDWFMPSYDEAVMLSGKNKPEEISMVFSEKGVKNVVIKLGEKGCYVKPFDGSGFYSPAYKAQTIDTSGAGDAFCAGFITGMIKGWGAPDCARFANAAGAGCVSAIGTTAGIKSFDQIKEIMDDE
jgi:sugar/nucleoside kinase (ribokinase family)